MRCLPLNRIRGPVLVVAPHPDDESLWCGGLIAGLRRVGISVMVVVVSDGSASHPASAAWPRARLAAKRRDEASAALEGLGVGPAARQFWDAPDAAVPRPGEPGFPRLVKRAAALLAGRHPVTVVLPWRRDPHRDHEAASAIFRTALGPSRLLEYPGWTGMLAGRHALPRRGEVRCWCHAVRGRGLKRRAVAAHASQLGRLIDDDPDGFVLTDRLRRRFEGPFETYWEARR